MIIIILTLILILGIGCSTKEKVTNLDKCSDEFKQDYYKLINIIEEEVERVGGKENLKGVKMDSRKFDEVKDIYNKYKDKILIDQEEKIFSVFITVMEHGSQEGYLVGLNSIAEIVKEEANSSVK